MKKGIAVLAVVIGGIVLLGVGGMLLAGLATALSPAASVGIIGGADGPTAITVSGPTGTAGVIAAIAIGLVIVALGAWGLRKARK